MLYDRLVAISAAETADALLGIENRTENRRTGAVDVLMDDPSASCIAVDLELGPNDRIHVFAAVREGAPPLTHRGGGLGPALARLDAYAHMR